MEVCETLSFPSFSLEARCQDTASAFLHTILKCVAKRSIVGERPRIFPYAAPLSVPVWVRVEFGCSCICSLFMALACMTVAFHQYAGELRARCIHSRSPASKMGVRVGQLPLWDVECRMSGPAPRFYAFPDAYFAAGGCVSACRIDIRIHVSRGKLQIRPGRDVSLSLSWKYNIHINW